jgi:signal peptidase I
LSGKLGFAFALDLYYNPSNVAMEKRSSLEELDTAAASQIQEPFVELDEGALAQAEAEAKTRKRWGGLRLLREVAETVLLTLLIFVVINTLTGRFRIEGPSMNPTLHENQYLVINKVVYRFHPPRRGDIVVFHHPRDPDRDLIKRVVGLPGEKVEIRQGQVYINGVPLQEPYVLHPGSRFVEYQLGPDDFFVLGDNRPNSDDSRNWGPLKEDQIVGKAWISYWPPAYWGGVSH